MVTEVCSVLGGTITSGLEGPGGLGPSASTSIKSHIKPPTPVAPIPIFFALFFRTYAKLLIRSSDGLWLAGRRNRPNMLSETRIEHMSLRIYLTRLAF